MCVCICLSRERAYPFIFRIFLSVFPFLRRIHSGTNRVFPVWWMTESSFVPSPTDKRRFSLFSTFLQFYIFLVSFFFSPPSKSEAHFLQSLMFQKNESKATSWTETVIAMMAYVGLSSTMWMRMTRKRKKKWATEAKDDKKKGIDKFHSVTIFCRRFSTLTFFFHLCGLFDSSQIVLARCLFKLQGNCSRKRWMCDVCLWQTLLPLPFLLTTQEKIFQQQMHLFWCVFSSLCMSVCRSAPIRPTSDSNELS